MCPNFRLKMWKFSSIPTRHFRFCRFARSPRETTTSGFLQVPCLHLGLTPFVKKASKKVKVSLTGTSSILPVFLCNVVS